MRAAMSKEAEWIESAEFFAMSRPGYFNGREYRISAPPEPRETLLIGCQILLLDNLE
jgi:hypothetical protein